MKTTYQRLALAGAVCLSLGLAASAVAQDRPAAPGERQAQGPQGPRGLRGADREKQFADMQHRRQERLHDLLQIKPDQEGAFRTFLAALQQPPPQRGPGRDAGGRRQGPGPQERLTTPERLDRMAQAMAERQQRAQKTASAVKAFYAVLTPEQRKAFDELPVLRVAGRGMGGPGFGGPRFGGHDGRGPWGGRMMRGPFQGPPPAPPR